jgi:hypothetical protein
MSKFRTLKVDVSQSSVTYCFRPLNLNFSGSITSKISSQQPQTSALESRVSFRPNFQNFDSFGMRLISSLNGSSVMSEGYFLKE